jgi:hypothetical protein
MLLKESRTALLGADLAYLCQHERRHSGSNCADDRVWHS